jgi:hypothetical protein
MPDLVDRLNSPRDKSAFLGRRGMSYQVASYNRKWNEIRNDTGSLLYWVNKRARQIYRVDARYVSGSINNFLSDNVTNQFSEEEIKKFCW